MGIYTRRRRDDVSVESYIARQPIFDRSIAVFAYELLFRSNMEQNFYQGFDADMASSKTIVESFHTIGIENITGGKRAFVNFTETLLLENIASLFPKDLLVVEVLEDVKPSPEIIEVCAWLRENGYTIALDDFVYDEAKKQMVELCHILKYDFLLSTPEEIQISLSKVDTTGKILLAEKIETTEMFHLAIEMGFHLFQGYFFSKPVTMKSRELAPLSMSYMLLLKEINKPEMDFDAMASIIRNDVALSYKLLKLVNSAYFSLRAKVTDIKPALAILGAKEVRKWISLMAMMGVGEGKPDELIKMSMIRARFMDELGAAAGHSRNRERLFLTGLFSLIDVLLDRTMEQALQSIVLPDDVTEALMEGKGFVGNFLNLVRSIEQCDWTETDRLAATVSSGVADVSKTYLEAVKWCNDLPM